mmetsp:Transcript_24443/g.42045  ORF Transcript_24443/g.42045 Transcript_24443/m.42045 type:complete len:82 (+) Transcript_24443:99-344(+)
MCKAHGELMYIVVEGGSFHIKRQQPNLLQQKQIECDESIYIVMAGVEGGCFPIKAQQFYEHNSQTHTKHPQIVEQEMDRAS